MGQVSAKLRRGDQFLTYWCQGCEKPHSVPVRPDGKNEGGAWGFNWDLEKPTFAPSVRVSSGHYTRGWKQGDPCWCSWNAAHPDDPGPACSLCHTFVRGGIVEFLGDCTHALAGQKLPLPDLPPHLCDR